MSEKKKQRLFTNVVIKLTLTKFESRSFEYFACFNLLKLKHKIIPYYHFDSTHKRTPSPGYFRTLNYTIKLQF